jgi:homoserine/homoserine lactone efflux protein
MRDDRRLLAWVNFARGVLVALSNPKTIAFFTAFLPWFIDPALPAGRQLAAMCIVSVLLAAARGFGGF